MGHFPRDHDVGDHCHLTLWVSKFETERVAVPPPPPSIIPLTFDRIFTTPLTDGFSGTEGILTTIGRRVGEAWRAVRKNDGTPYVTQAKALAIQNAITAYVSSSTAADPDKDFRHFFVNPIGAEENTLFDTLCQCGFLIPPKFGSPDAADRPALQRLLYGDAATGTPPIWDMNLPDLAETPGTSKRFGDATYEELFLLPARLLYVEQRTTYMAIKEARELGILRVHESLQPVAFPPPNSTVAEFADGTYRLLTGSNRKCCGPGGCKSTLLNKYCEEVSPGLCNSMSDPC